MLEARDGGISAPFQLDRLFGPWQAFQLTGDEWNDRIGILFYWLLKQKFLGLSYMTVLSWAD